MISACPDIRCVTIEPGTDEFMVLACDGIWNSKKSQEVVDFVSERIRERGETQLSKICEEVRGQRTGCGSMSCRIFYSCADMSVDPKVGSMISEDLSTKSNIGSMIQSDPAVKFDRSWIP